MLKFGASKSRVSGGPGSRTPPGSAPDSLMRVFPQYKNANISNFVLAVPLKNAARPMKSATLKCNPI